MEHRLERLRRLVQATSWSHAVDKACVEIEGLRERVERLEDERRRLRHLVSYTFDVLTPEYAGRLPDGDWVPLVEGVGPDPAGCDVVWFDRCGRPYFGRGAEGLNPFRLNAVRIDTPGRPDCPGGACRCGGGALILEAHRDIDL